MSLTVVGSAGVSGAQLCDTRGVLILLRHGRTPNNAQARLQGQFDSPLDEVGEAQAIAAGRYLRERFDIDHVVTSSLTRTRDTARLAGFGGQDVVVDDRWREIDFGEYDDRAIGEVIVDLHQRRRDDPHYEPGGGESMVTMHGRVSEACASLAAEAVDRDILVVTHATPIKSAAVWALGGDPSMMLGMWVNLATVTLLDQLHGDVLLREFNVKPTDLPPSTD